MCICICIIASSGCSPWPQAVSELSVFPEALRSVVFLQQLFGLRALEPRCWSRWQRLPPPITPKHTLRKHYHGQNVKYWKKRFQVVRCEEKIKKRLQKSAHILLDQRKLKPCSASRNIRLVVVIWSLRSTVHIVSGQCWDSSPIICCHYDIKCHVMVNANIRAIHTVSIFWNVDFRFI